MSDSHLMCRSNYFRVRDPDGFRAFCAKWNLEVSEADGRFSFAAFDRPWALHFYCTGYVELDEEWNQDHPVGGLEFLEQLTAQIAEGEVAIVMAVAYDGLHSVNADAIALSPGKKHLTVDLEDIYCRVRDRWGMEFTPLPD